MEEIPTCCICLENISNKKIKLDCNHLFHYDCISKIKNNKCPLCREKIFKADLCLGNHPQGPFCTSCYYKSGKCRFCELKSFKTSLKDKIVY